MSKQCDLDAQDELGYTAIHYAIIRNNFETAQALISTPYITLNVISNE
jgi:ankyrin repeat protein